MSDKHFVDTNILMYAHDTAAGDKHRRARALVEELWDTRAGVSTQVLQELAVNRALVRRNLNAKATRDVVSDYLCGNGRNSGDWTRRRSTRNAASALLGKPCDPRSRAGAGSWSEDLSDASGGTVRVKNPLTNGE